MVGMIDGWGGGGERGLYYERKVDLPQSGSPRRRMVTVGELSSMNNYPLIGFTDFGVSTFTRR